MFKIFDHDGDTGQWESVDNVEKELTSRFDTSYWQDKDNEFKHYIEVWDSETNTITIHCATEGSWLYNNNDEGNPYFYRDYGSVKDYINDDYFRPTKLNPTKDYIIV